MKSCIARGKWRDAYNVLQNAIVLHPDHPVILSYLGYLDAAVGGMYRNGIEKCLSAVDSVKKLALQGGESTVEKMYPVLYLNLGRAYLAAGKKKEAADAYRSGLRYDRRNRELQNELLHMGIRKTPPISFLDRSNSVNIFLGRILRKASQDAVA